MTKAMAERVRQAAERAELDFWERVAREFPEATMTGDFGIQETIEFGEACRGAVALWAEYNVPGADPEDSNPGAEPRPMGVSGAARAPRAGNARLPEPASVNWDAARDADPRGEGWDGEDL